MADLTFYSTVAGVVPVLFLTLAVDRGGFLRPMPTEDVDRLVAEQESVQRLSDSSHALASTLEKLAAKLPEPADELHRQIETMRSFDKPIKESMTAGLRKSNALTTAYVGLFLIAMLGLTEAAALKTCVSQRPTEAGRFICEAGLLLGGAMLLFSFIDPEVRKVGDIRGWRLGTSQTVGRVAAVLTASALLVMWQLI
jgi:hypothetical protein